MRKPTIASHFASAVGFRVATGALEHEAHQHREAQLLYVVRGELTCEASDAWWVVPPGSALWVPGNVSHRIRARAPLEGYNVYVAPAVAPTLACCALAVTALFREVMIRLAEQPTAHLAAVLLDELPRLTVDKHRVPMPRDPRLQRLVAGITARPGEGSLATWARRIGVAERTLNRLLVAETGLSFGRWRQQLHLVLALQRLSRGASVHEVACDLGYQPSSFVTMFKKALGASPARYMRRGIVST